MAFRAPFLPDLEERRKPDNVRSASISLAGGRTGTFTTMDVRSQTAALKIMAKMFWEDSTNPLVKNAATAIVTDCAARDDVCELEAIFNAVKYGTPRVAGLKHGLKYMSDPRSRDYYVSPARLLQLGADGQTIAGDCDDHAMLCAALAASLGFRAGVRAWRQPGAKDFSHVYAVAILPKDGTDDEDSEPYGLDTSADVGDSKPGWDPPGDDDQVIMAMPEEEDD